MPRARESIWRRLRCLEREIGLAVLTRGFRDPDPNLRGRATLRRDHVVLEYRDDTPGYFWHHDILHELVDRLEAGLRDFELYEGDETRDLIDS